MKIHVFSTGRLVWKKHALRGSTPLALPLSVFDRRRVGFPVNCYVIEHADGLIAIDSGAHAHAVGIRGVYRPEVAEADELGPRMRAAGLDPAEVRHVILTHLDVDHAGGLHHLPNAEIWLHRPEYEFATTRIGRWRYQPQIWPADFTPNLYELVAQPYTSFDASMPVTPDGTVRIVPLPGHSVGHVGVIVEDGQRRLLFSGDHTLNQNWFLQDLAANRPVMQAQFGRSQAKDTTRRIARLLEDSPTVLVPAHDPAAAHRLAVGATVAPVPSRQRSES